jgi:hypothetical protein
LKTVQLLRKAWNLEFPKHYLHCNRHDFRGDKKRNAANLLSVHSSLSAVVWMGFQAMAKSTETIYMYKRAERVKKNIMQILWETSVYHSGWTVYGINCLRPSKHWDRRFESH